MVRGSSLCRRPSPVPAATTDHLATCWRAPGCRGSPGCRAPAPAPCRTCRPTRPPPASVRSAGRGCPSGCGSKPSGRPTPSSWTVTRRRDSLVVPPRTAETSTVPRVALAEAVFQGVLQDLGEHHGQRGGDLRVQDAEAAGAPGGDLARARSRRPSRAPGRRSRRTPRARPGSGTASRARSRSSRPAVPPPPAPRGRAPTPSAGPGGATGRPPSGGCSSPGGGSPGWSRPW